MIILIGVFVANGYIITAQNVESFTSSPGLNVPISSTKSSTIAVSVVHSPTLINSSWGIYRIRVNITHNSKEYITLRLTSPGGITRNLVSQPGSPAMGYRYFTDTWFRDDAAMSLAALYATAGCSPNNTPGAWLPEQTINGFNTGVNPNGNWTLTIVNGNGTYAATLNSWEIEFRDTPGGDRTSSIWVTNSESGYTAYDDCSAAIKMDKYHNYYGRTRLTYTCNTATDPLISGTVGTPWNVTGGNRTNMTMDNSIWYSFMTDAAGGSVDVNFTYISKYAGTGYQATVVDAGSGACVAANWNIVTGNSYIHNKTWGNTYDPISGATIGNAIIYNSIIKCTGLAANKVYYICVDGNGNTLGTNCTGGTPQSDVDFQIEATGAVKTNYSSLPIELRSFSGLCKDEKKFLNWSTYSETNNDFFTIEKTSDLIHYSFVGKIEGAGSSNYIHEYDFSDESFTSEVVYYRLKQTDYDGKYEYFGPIAVACNNKNGNLINIYPNPARNFVIISNLPTNTERVELTDLLGNLLLSDSTVVENKIELKSLNLAKGLYLLKIESDYQTYIRKVLIN
jgi:subtilisin-like proprotein convertase family protein